VKESYHHGNLKRDLLETSIHIISEEGFEHLSLRNISAKCGVSHNAVYRHFDSKEQLISACQKYVTEEFVNYLEYRVNGEKTDTLGKIERLSYSYIEFYQEHPSYYSFLFRNSSAKIYITIDEKNENYPPYVLFCKYYNQYAREKGLSEADTLVRLTRLWALLHGLTALLISKNIEWNGNWKACLGKEIF
jgi:AcrR family transcriptional regulator